MEKHKIIFYKSFRDYVIGFVLFIFKVLILSFSFIYISFLVLDRVGDLIESTPKNQQVSAENELLKSFGFLPIK